MHEVQESNQDGLSCIGGVDFHIPAGCQMAFFSSASSCLRFDVVGADVALRCVALLHVFLL